MESNLFDKIVTAVRVILYQQLKENCDDTYSNKLVDEIELCVQKFSDKQIKSLLFVIQKALDDNDESCHESVNVCTGFKLIGVLLASSFHRNILNSEIKDCLKCLKKFILSVTDNVKPDLNLQCAFLFCISKLCHPNGLLFLLEDDSLLLTGFHLLSESKGHYVVREARKLIISLTELSIKNQNLTSLLDPYIHQMLLLQRESHIICLAELLENTPNCDYYISNYNLVSVFKSKYEHLRPEFAVVYCRAFGKIVKQQEDIDLITNDLIKKRLVKPLISLFRHAASSTSLIDPSAWFLFVVGPVVGFNYIPEDIISQRYKKSSLVQLFDSVTVSDQMFALNIINSKNYKEVKIAHIEVSLKIFTNYTAHVKSDHNRSLKVVVELLKAIENIYISLLSDTKILSTVFVNLLQIKNIRVTLEVLKLLRELRKKCYMPLEDDLRDEIQEIIIESLKLNDLSVIHSCLDFLNTEINFSRKDLHNNQSLLPTLIQVWDYCKKDYLSSEAMESLIPLLMIIQFDMSTKKLEQLGIKAEDAILESLFSYLPGENGLRESILDSLLSFLPELVSQRYKFMAAFFQKNGLILSQLVVEETEHKILSKIFDIWECLFIDSIKDKETCNNNLKLMYECGVFDGLKLVLNDRFLSPETKLFAYNRLLKLRAKLFEQNIQFADAMELFTTCKKPDLKVIETHFNQEAEEMITREKVFTEIFGDEEVLPTQDLINKLASRPCDSQISPKKEKNLDYISVDDITDFLENFTLEETQNEGVTDSFCCLLNDILLAKDYKCTIPSDCY